MRSGYKGKKISKLSFQRENSKLLALSLKRNKRRLWTEGGSKGQRKRSRWYGKEVEVEVNQRGKGEVLRASRAPH